MFFGSGFPFGDFDGFSQQQQEDNEPIDNETYYKILEVDKNATTEQIKKAFKKKAIKMHPDKGGDPKAFQDLSVAHDVLSDPEKRKVYDRYGEKGIKQGMTSQESHFGDIFDIFGGGDRQQRTGKGGKPRTKDSIYPLKINLEDVYLGKQSKLQVTRRKLCEQCNGVGGKSKQQCSECKGRGVVIKMQQLGPGMFSQTQTHCSNCKGEGTIIKTKDKCKICDGEGTIKEKKILTCDVAQGVPDGYRYTFYGESDEAEGCIPGDIIIEVQVNEHQKFKRKGFDLIHQAKISLNEALTGLKLELIHLDGKPRYITTQPGEIISPGDIKTVKELGLPKFTTPYEFGNLFIQFEIEFPTSGSLSQQNVQRLKKALQMPSFKEIKLPSDPKQIHIIKNFSEDDLNPYRESRGGEAYEEDDYKKAKGGGVKCRQM